MAFVTYLNDLRKERGVKFVDIHRELQERGVAVSYELVTRWFKTGPTARPMSATTFAAVCDVIGLSIEERDRAMRLASEASAA